MRLSSRTEPPDNLAAMPEGENVQVVKRMYEAWDALDLDTVYLLLDPQVAWVNPDYAVEPGTRHGHDGFATALRNLAASFDQYSHLLGDAVDYGDRLLWHTVFRARGRDSGAAVDIPEQHLWTLRAGKIVELRWFHDVAEAEQAAAQSVLDAARTASLDS
jgi:ketosteroid isomerase-like protein